MKNLEENTNFIKIFDFFSGDSTYYLVMDYVAGKSLKEELRNLFELYEDPEIYLSLVRIILKQVLIGLEFMH